LIAADQVNPMADALFFFMLPDFDEGVSVMLLVDKMFFRLRYG
jgi:hypothetical protein